MRTTNVIRIAGVALVLLALMACDFVEEKVMRRTKGEILFNRLCSECHGENGRGNTPREIGNAAADLTDDAVKHGSDDVSMAMVIRQGVFGEMPAHPELRDEQVRMLIEHIHRLQRESRGM